MKKLVAVLLIVISSFSLKASHIMGGEITYKEISSLKYEVSLLWYRDCRGISLNGAGTINVRCTNGSNRTISLSLISIDDITPLCDTVSSRCNPSNTTGTGEGIEKHTYRGIIDFNSTPLSSLANCTGIIVISASINARNGAITTGPSGTVYIDAELDLVNAPDNSSPVISAIAPAILCCNQPFFYTFNAIDTADYDSVSYSWAQPRSAYNTITPYSGSFSYQNPFSVFDPRPNGGAPIPNANPPIGLYLNNITGELIFTPINCYEVTVAVIKITEWRDDSLGVAQIIGNTYRDMQFIVKNCPNNNPPVANGPYLYSVCEGDELCFNITTYDAPYTPPPPASPYPSDTTTLTWDGAIIGATFNILSDTVLYQKGRFCWTPPAGSSSKLPYNFVATIKDNACPLNAISNRSYRIKVNKRASTSRILSKLSNDLYHIEAQIDSSTFRGVPTHSWSILDSSSNLVTDTTIVKFVSSESYSSSNFSDSIYINRNGLFVLKSTINNSPYNCSTIYYDTLQIDSVLQTIINYPKDTLVCAGSSIVLNTTTAFGQGTLSYQWFINDTTLLLGDTLSTLALSNIPRLFNSTYSIQVTDSTGKINKDKIRIRSRDNHDMNFENTYVGCGGTPISLTIDSAFANILWNDGSSDYNKTFTTAASVYVTYQDSFSCIYSDSMSIQFPNLPSPELQDSSTCGATMTVTAGSFESYVWNGNDSLNTESIHIYYNGIYTVTVTDSNGCQNSDTATFTAYNAPVPYLGLDIATCNDSVNLNSNISGPYSWNTGSTDSIITVRSSGKYYLDINYSNGCITTDTIEVFLNHIPSGSIGPDTALCANSYTTNAPTGYNYLWNDGSRLSYKTITSSGQYSVLIYSSSGCQSRDTVQVILKSPPILNLGNDTATCALPVLLDAGNHTSYSWNNGSISRQLNASISGLYSVIVTDSNGCSGSDTTIVSIYDNPIVNLGNDTTFCGDSLILDAGIFTNYFWSSGSMDKQIIATNNGSNHVTVTDSNGCNASDTINVTLNTNANIPMLTRKGDVITSNLGGTHQWFKDNNIINGQTDSFITMSGIGEYNAVSIDSNSCISNTSNTISKTAGIDKPFNSKLKVYPNPSSGKVTIDVTGLGSVLSIKLYDNLGGLIENKHTINGSQIELEWTTRSGILWVEVATESGVYRCEVMSVR